MVVVVSLLITTKRGYSPESIPSYSKYTKHALYCCTSTRGIILVDALTAHSPHNANMSNSLSLPPYDAGFGDPTPSGLTPNTRSEVEEAFFQNTLTQTDSAAPVSSSRTDEARTAYRRPGVVRASSHNYERALKTAHAQTSASSDLSTDTESPDNVTGQTVMSPSQSSPFPPPGQGVVPDYSAVGLAQADSLKKSRSRGLSLGALAQQQTWNEQDYKRLYNVDLMSEVKKDAGYASGTQNKP